MTLVIGLQCTDGVVIGADGAATMCDALGQSTIRQNYKKLEMIHQSVIVGNSGPVGLAQMIREKITELWQSKEFVSATPCQAMGKLRDGIRQPVMRALQDAAVAEKAVGNLALQSALCNTIVAMPVSNKPCLIHLDHQCAPQLATIDLPFMSIGSGQRIADPFLAFLKRIFWPNDLPDINMGTFSVFWTLEHAIHFDPGGVADPKQIINLTHDGRRWCVNELADSELQEHKESVAAAEDYLREYPSQVTSQEVEEPPKPKSGK